MPKVSHYNIFCASFTLCASEICGMFVYTHTEIKECVKKQPNFKKNANFTGK